MCKWEKVTLGDAVALQRGHDLPKTRMVNGKYPVIGSSGIIGYHNKYTTNAPSITIGRSGHGVGRIFLCKEISWSHNTTIYIKDFKNNNPYFIFYLLQTLNLSHYSGGSAVPTLNRNHIYTIPILLPPLEEQKRIAAILSSLDDKIEVNNQINKNLEEQAQALFKSWFENDIETRAEKEGEPLSKLISVIDNRGKTPPLSAEITAFPILDVRSLSGKFRIINYKDCTKYVEKATYDTWFRSGHPQKLDILLSTVGSVAEMKLFMKNVGCIAQNVVSLRCHGISPYYLYQYLLHIKNDLISYNIGSVQPSIKVTHILKHPVFIPEKQKLERFTELSKSITEKIFSSCEENNRLSAIRDALLPKLMNGEIDG